MPPPNSNSSAEASASRGDKIPRPPLHGFTSNGTWTGGKAPSAFTAYRDRQHPYGGPNPPSIHHSRSTQVSSDPAVQPSSGPAAQPSSDTSPQVPSYTPPLPYAPTETRQAEAHTSSAQNSAVGIQEGLSQEPHSATVDEAHSLGHQNAESAIVRDELGPGDETKNADADGDSVMGTEDAGGTTPKHQHAQLPPANSRQPEKQRTAPRALPEVPPSTPVVGYQPWARKGSYTSQYRQPDPAPAATPIPGHHPYYQQFYHGQHSSYNGGQHLNYDQAQHQNYAHGPSQYFDPASHRHQYFDQGQHQHYAGVHHQHNAQHQHQHNAHLQHQHYGQGHNPGIPNHHAQVYTNYSTTTHPPPGQYSSNAHSTPSHTSSDADSEAGSTVSHSTASTIRTRKRRRHDVGDRDTHVAPPIEASSTAELQSQAQTFYLKVMENIGQLDQFIRSGPFAAQGDVTRLTQVQEQLLESTVTTNNLLRQLLQNPIQPPLPPTASSSDPSGPATSNSTTSGTPSHSPPVPTPPTDGARKKVPLRRVHKSSGALALHNAFRKFIQDNVKAEPADRAKFASWKPTDGPPCDPSHLYLDLSSTPCSPWNKAVREIIIHSFLQTDDPLIATLKPTIQELRDLYRSNFRTIRAIHERQSNPDPVGEEKRRQDHRRAVRKYTLFWHRVEVLEHFEELRPFLDIMAYLHVEGMSTDESDHNTATGVPAYYVRRKHWLNLRITSIFQVCDALWRFLRMTKHTSSQDQTRLAERAAFPRSLAGQTLPRKKADRGARPHIRLGGDKICPRLPICGLPIDFYDEAWLKQQTPVALSILRPQAASGINFEIHPNLLALSLNNHGQLGALYPFVS